MAYVFLLVYVLPLLTIGFYQLRKRSRATTAGQAIDVSAASPSI